MRDNGVITVGRTGIGEEVGEKQRCLDACILISWGDDPYLYTINMTEIEITNINGNTKTFYQFLIRKQVLVSIA